MSSETSILIISKRYKDPEDIYHFYVRENNPEDSVLRPYISCEVFLIFPSLENSVRFHKFQKNLYQVWME
jgi:hypothetical protein